MSERRPRHDDMHFPLARRGKRATKRLGISCGHDLLNSGRCARCGKQIKPAMQEGHSNG